MHDKENNMRNNLVIGSSSNISVNSLDEATRTFKEATGISPEVFHQQGEVFTDSQEFYDYFKDLPHSAKH